MTAPYLLSSSTVVPATLETAFDGVLNAPLEKLFPHRAGLIPPIKECTGQVGAWDTVGKTRTVVLADGTSNTETLVEFSRPGNYRYQLSDFVGPMKALVAGVDGQFSFVPDGSGTRVTWSWAIRPTNAVARLALPVVGIFWRQYAAKMWPLYAASLPA
ncbi:MAG: SRPBCC family protein [Marmoricola sp.]